MPVVSIHCMAYNHEPFIRDALEGFLMQETTFPVEILIHDDASQDRTADIIREYAVRHPKLFKPIYQVENQYSRGNKPGSANMARARGEFLAWCEGDDCWIDPGKLQKQIRLMEKNPEVSLTFHNAWMRHEDSRKDYFINHGLNKEEFDFRDLVPRGWFIATASMICRTKLVIFPKMFAFTVGGDLVVHLNLSLQGPVRYLNFVGSVYRIHEKGVSNSFNKRGNHLHEKILPDRFWVYWLFGRRLIPRDDQPVVRKYLLFIIELMIDARWGECAVEDLPRRGVMGSALVDALQRMRPEVAAEDAPDCEWDPRGFVALAVPSGLVKWFQSRVRTAALGGRPGTSFRLMWHALKRGDLSVLQFAELLSKACAWGLRSGCRCRRRLIP